MPCVVAAVIKKIRLLRNHFVLRCKRLGGSTAGVLVNVSGLRWSALKEKGHFGVVRDGVYPDTVGYFGDLTNEIVSH